MGMGIVSSPLVLESLQDRLQEAESNSTIPLRAAHQLWRQRAAERESAQISAWSKAEYGGVTFGKVVAVAAAVAAAAAVYRALSSQSATPDTLNRIRELVPEPSSAEPNKQISETSIG